MRLLTFSDDAQDAVRRPGVLIDRRIFALQCDSLEACASLGRAALDELVAQARHPEGKPLEEVRLRAPVVPCKNVFCVGRNYLEHAQEGARAFGRQVKTRDVPEFFTKAVTAIADPNATLKFSSHLSQEYDWEGELAIVIGKAGRDIADADAGDHIFGYTCLNDITARNLQRAHGQWFKGKSLDQSCPLGPWIVTPEEIGDAQDLKLEVRVNGVSKQAASTATMIFPITRIIAELSRGLTLEPADVIATGTPAGVGFARTPPEFFHDGDRVEVEIERIGNLRNTIAIS
ncbi:MAG: fumarylacetoacetate hydrolase family protein [Candidatus Eremiobacteraeota bacterium]|nr:fumarylacetoacetate hydrolase family protein [Candidatus Eremiobacteraeota bacterium]